MWAKQLENSLKFGYFINDEIVGCSGLLIEKAAKISHTATLFGMYVKDGVRGSGVGLALVNFIKRLCKEKSCKAFVSWL
jgi:GNAT superfamily N-acetyltransferase